MKRLSIMAVLTAAAGLQAGEIDVNLQSLMDRTPVNEQLSALIYLDHQADVDQLMSQMLADRLTRHERHAAVVALQVAVRVKLRHQAALALTTMIELIKCLVDFYHRMSERASE